MVAVDDPTTLDSILNNPILFLELIVSTIAILTAIYTLFRWFKNIQLERYDKMEKNFGDKISQVQDDLCDQIHITSEKTTVILEEQNKNFDRLSNTLDKVNDKLDKSTEILVRDDVVLEHHEKRICKLEDKIEDNNSKSAV